MATKDNFDIQAARIKQTVGRLCANCVVSFDEARKPHGIRFRITDGLGTPLTDVHPEYHVSEVADWSDEKLQQMIESLSGGRVREPR